MVSPRLEADTSTEGTWRHDVGLQPGAAFRARPRFLMEPISRRTALGLGGVGVLMVAAGGAGLVAVLSTTPDAPVAVPAGPELAQPELIRSVDGLLAVTLVAAPSQIVIGGTRVNALTYNGTLPGPTLVVRPGDTLAVTHTNQLNDATNLHTHGLHVSPEGSSDNVFVRIDSRRDLRLPV